jgi:hypothetical protein
MSLCTKSKITTRQSKETRIVIVNVFGTVHYCYSIFFTSSILHSISTEYFTGYMFLTLHSKHIHDSMALVVVDGEGFGDGRCAVLRLPCFWLGGVDFGGAGTGVGSLSLPPCRTVRGLLP